MSWFKKTDEKSEVRKNNRRLQKTVREIETDKRRLERQEKELENEIKKLAKKGEKEACTALAKQLVQIRKQKTREVALTAQLNAVQAQNTNAYSTAKMAQIASDTAKVMKTVEKRIDYSKINKTLREYADAQEHFGLTDEMVNETLDSMLDESGDEEEQDAIINQVLDEIGIDMNAQLSKIPKIPGSKQEVTNTSELTDADLEEMVAKLNSS